MNTLRPLIKLNAHIMLHMTLVAEWYIFIVRKNLRPRSFNGILTGSCTVKSSVALIPLKHGADLFYLFIYFILFILWHPPGIIGKMKASGGKFLCTPLTTVQKSTQCLVKFSFQPRQDLEIRNRSKTHVHLIPEWVLNFCITYLLWRCLQSVCALYKFFFSLFNVLFLFFHWPMIHHQKNHSHYYALYQNKTVCKASLWSSCIGYKGRILGKGYGINVMLLGKAWGMHRNLGKLWASSPSLTHPFALPHKPLCQVQSSDFVILGKGYGINVILLGKAWGTHRNLGNFEQAAHLSHTHTHSFALLRKPLWQVQSLDFIFKLEKVKLRNNPWSSEWSSEWLS